MLLLSDFAVCYVEQRLNVGDDVGNGSLGKTQMPPVRSPHSKFYMCLKIKTDQSLIENKVKDL